MEITCDFIFQKTFLWHSSHLRHWMYHFGWYIWEKRKIKRAKHAKVCPNLSHVLPWWKPTNSRGTRSIWTVLVFWRWLWCIPYLLRLGQDEESLAWFGELRRCPDPFSLSIGPYELPVLSVWNVYVVVKYYSMSLRFVGGEGGSDCFVLGLLVAPLLVVTRSSVSLQSPAWSWCQHRLK